MKKSYLIILMFTLCACSKHGNVNYYSDFLKDDKYIIVGNNVNVRSKPDIESEVLTQMKITAILTVLERSGAEYSDGVVTGEWVYVDTGRLDPDDFRKHIKGWMLDYYLAQANQFEKVTEFYEFTFFDGYGSYIINYDFKKDGTCVLNVTEYCYEKRGVIVTEKIKGVLWRYRNVIIAETGGWVSYFNIDNGRLCFRGDKYICTDLENN